MEKVKSKITIGSFIFKDGAIYDGDWVDDEPSGFGLLNC